MSLLNKVNRKKNNKISQTDGLEIKLQSFLICAGEYHMEPSSPNLAGATTFSHHELFLETVS